MLNKNRHYLVLLNMLAEIAILCISFQLSYFIRFSLLNGEENIVVQKLSKDYTILLYSMATVFLFYIFHLYIPVHRSPLPRELTRVLILNAMAVLVMGSLLFLTRATDFSRILLGLYWLISTASICIKRAIWHGIVRRRYRDGIGLQHVIVVGSGPLAMDYLKDIRDNPQYGRMVDGYIGNRPDVRLGKHFGTLDRTEEILDAVSCDEIILALETDESAYIQPVLMAAGKEGLRVSLIPSIRDFFPSHPTMETVGRSILIDLRATPLENLLNSFVKRAMDVLGSLLLLILLSPVMIITAAGVKLDSPGPILFRQRRVGKNKKEFTMLKFRSMRVNQDENTAWSTGNDPRRTRFGCFIRKYSIDELPQLFNVLVGDMSLIGPRPELPYFVYQFKESVPLYLVRQQVRPGMTGWAQVHGLRGDTSIEKRVKYDIWYIENWSLALDLRILVLTLLGGFINQEELENAR